MNSNKNSISPEFVFSSLSFFAGLTTSMLLFNCFLDKHMVYSDSKKRKIEYFEKPELVQINDVINNDSIKYKEVIETFSNFLINTFPSEYLINFYNNINGLSIIEKSFKFHNFYSDVHLKGRYNLRKNKILTVNDNYTIYHELFHLASSVYKNKVLYSGLSQCSRKGKVCDSINEGYTQLLTIRYFDDKSCCYPFETKVASLIEEIISKDKMEKFYFSNDLNGFVDALSEYSNKEQATKFISKIDFISKYFYEDKKSKYKIKLLKEAYDYIADFLYNAELKKLINEYDEGNITHTSLECRMLIYAIGINECNLYNEKSFKRYELVDTIETIKSIEDKDFERQEKGFIIKKLV